MIKRLLSSPEKMFGCPLQCLSSLFVMIKRLFSSPEKMFGCPRQCLSSLLLKAFTIGACFNHSVGKTVPWICYPEEKLVFPDIKSRLLLEDILPLVSGVAVFSEVEETCCDTPCHRLQ